MFSILKKKKKKIRPQANKCHLQIFWDTVQEQNPLELLVLKNIKHQKISGASLQITESNLLGW